MESKLLKWDFGMYLVSILGILRHSGALLYYFWKESTVFGFSAFAGDYKIIGECSGIFLCIVLACGIFKKILILVQLYWFGMLIYLIVHINFSIPLLEEIEFKWSIVACLVTIGVVSFNLGLSMVFIIKVHSHRSKSQEAVADIEKPEVIEEVIPPDLHDLNSQINDSVSIEFEDTRL